MSGINLKILRSIILGLIMILTMGCVEYDEKLWLEKDLSGHLIYSFGFPDPGNLEQDNPASIYDEFNIENRLDSIEGIKMVSKECFSSDDNNMSYMKVELEFDHVHLLNQIQAEWLGSFKIFRNEDGNLVYERYIDLSDSIPGGDDQLSLTIKKAMLGHYNWTYTTYFPSRILEENGFDLFSDKGSNNVIWQYSFSGMLDTGKTMEAVFWESNYFKRKFKSKIIEL